MRGRFITFEGIDGCGKSTVSKLAAERLGREGVRTAWTCEPTGTWLGQAVKRGYAEKVGPFAEAFLFMADRVEHIKQIKGQMENGTVVLSDRYLDSTVAYQGAGLEDEPGLKGVDALDWLRKAHQPFLLVPDLTIYLRVTPEVGLARLSGRAHLTKFEKLDFLRKVARNYDTIAQSEPGRVKVLDAAGGLEKVVSASLAEIRKIL